MVYVNLLLSENGLFKDKFAKRKKFDFYGLYNQSIYGELKAGTVH